MDLADGDVLEDVDVHESVAIEMHVAYTNRRERRGRGNRSAAEMNALLN